MTGGCGGGWSRSMETRWTAEAACPEDAADRAVDWVRIGDVAGGVPNFVILARQVCIVGRKICGDCAVVLPGWWGHGKKIWREHQFNFVLG